MTQHARRASEGGGGSNPNHCFIGLPQGLILHRAWYSKERMMAPDHLAARPILPLFWPDRFEKVARWRGPV